ncbi:MAG: aconitate hydratase [Spirochaetes bacterium GWF1_41_5]|nr:MAG: aconitate hydratase [Spirochaetes bacterium GWF1_41_5]HBE01554.1 aconitate hydratase [Spirochaetia bacterium]
MKKNIVYKILENHLMAGKPEPDNEIGIKIDQTLTQDATGTMACLQFEAMGINRVKTELSVSYVDHNTLQEGFENADDHRYLKSAAARYGIYFSRPGNGICHQVHLERFGVPGKTLLGSDSHTPTGGALGMMAIGAGGLDIASAMAGNLFYLTCPRVIKIELTGKLRKWVSAKDIILHILGILSTKGNVNTVLEYGGDGVKTLTVPERAVITNMGAETGATTSIFPSDEITRIFMKAQKREKEWSVLEADHDALYDRTITLNLNDIVPMAALPHSPGNIAGVKSLAGKKVNQVAIGSCTNSSLRDLFIAGKILSRGTVHPDVSCIVAPGSRQVLSMISENGILSGMISSGVRIMENTCGFCIGNGQAPESGAISVRTSNRNFEGRSGTPSAQVYLVSPESAALAALHGCFVDPLSMPEADYPEYSAPEYFAVDDRMIIPPAPDAKIEIIRGPNIGEPPKNTPLPETVSAQIIIKTGDKITTDHIMPAGARLKYRSNIKKYSEFVFEMIDSGFWKKALALKEKGLAGIILAGESYGQGSSREHAAMCPMYLGIKAVIAKSFERIHAANLINFGILPLVFVNPSDYNRLDANDEIVLKNISRQITDGKIIITNTSKNISFSVHISLSTRQQKILLAGGLLNYSGK